MLRTFAGVALTTAILITQAIPARAGDTLFLKSVASSWPSSYTATATSTGGVSVRWVANGDKLYVKDTAADGRRVGAWFFITGSGWVDGICYNTLGAGKTGLCDLELTEGRDLTIYLVSCDADTANCFDGDQWKVLLPIIYTHT